MIDLFRQLCISQLEAALAMLRQCIAACPPEQYDGKIANDTFRQVAYHALFYFDFYLSRSEQDFQLRELHHRGGDERGSEMSAGLSKEDAVALVALCRQKIHDILNAETEETLRGPSGFSRRKSPRAEVHVYNIRHTQHHVGQLSAYLRKHNPAWSDRASLPWIGEGWREALW